MQGQTVILLAALAFVASACAGAAGLPDAAAPSEVPSTPGLDPLTAGDAGVAEERGAGLVERLPQGVPVSDTRAEVLAEIVEVLPSPHPQAKHLVRLRLLELREVPGSALPTVAVSEVLEALTKEDLGGLTTGARVTAILVLRGDERGQAYWLVRVQEAAEP